MKELYSGGPCPVCRGDGEMIILLSLASNQAVFYCPSCELALDELPNPPDHCDKIQSLDEVAPGGFRLPSKAEAERLVATGIEPLKYEDWAPEIEPNLNRSS